MPEYGCINEHASLLPAYRGAAPIQWALLDGCEKTGVTIMYMAEGLDTGDIIASEETSVGEKTTEQLYDELARVGARLLTQVLPKIADGSADRIPQNDALASYAPMVFKEEGIIDFSKTARQVCCLVRGFESWPGASTTLEGKVMKVHMARPGRTLAEIGRQLPLGSAAPEEDQGAEKLLPGSVISAGKQGIELLCADGSVYLTNIQMPGKKAMEASAFLLGHKIEKGTVLGTNG